MKRLANFVGEDQIVSTVSGLRDVIMVVLRFTQVQAVVMLFFAQQVMAVMSPTPVLDPANYRSPSGEFIVEVDPTDLYGRGAANYRLSRNGKTVWSSEKPFTLYEAGVTDAGIIAGYAYTYGIDGFARSRSARDDLGEFQLVIIAPTGELLLQDKSKRIGSRFLHTRPNPLAKGLIIDGSNDRFIVRLNNADVNSRGEQWWEYQLSTGTALGKRELISDDPNVRALIRAKAILGTPLILLHYWRYADHAPGARFALVDKSFHEVWSLNLPKDYVVSNDEAAEDRLQDQIWAAGAVLNTVISNQFEIRIAATAERVTYKVWPDAARTNAWAISEVSRVKYTETPPSRDELPVFPNRSLKQLGVFAFSDGPTATKPPIRKIVGFDFDDRGRIGFIRAEDEKRYSFVLISEGGDVAGEFPLTIQEDLLKNDRPKTAWLSSNLWIITASDKAVGGKGVGWWIEATSGKIKKIPDFNPPPVKSITGSRDGGFVVLATTRLKYSMEDALIAFDKNGRRKWQIKQNNDGRESSLFSPEDLTVTTGNQVAVLDNIHKAVQVFSDQGAFLKSFKLEAAWGRKPNYPSGIAADKNDGIIIRDFNGSPPLVRMSADGRVIGQYGLKHADGRVIDPTFGVKVSPSGRVWVSDGDCLVRVNDEGIADLLLGDPPVGDRLEKVATLTVDQRGQLYAVDQRTGTVHVFDKQGKRDRVCRPDVTDFQEKLYSAHVAADAEGFVYLSNGMRFHDNPRWLVFPPDGQRRMEKRFGLDDIKELLYPLPSGKNHLIVGYQNAFLVDPVGRTLRTIERKPDRKWLARPERASVAPDGSFAIVTGGGHYRNQSWQINLYDSSGKPMRTVLQPPDCMDSCFVFTGKYIVTRTKTEICVSDDHGKPVQKFAPAMDGFDTDSWECFSTNGGREVWFTCAERKTVVRFELPL